jgi:hypothetical protein
MKISLPSNTVVEVNEGKCFKQVCLNCGMVFVVFPISRYHHECFSKFGAVTNLKVFDMFHIPCINLLTPNDSRCHAVSPLNCWTTYEDVANSVSKFWRNFVHSYLKYCSVLVSCRTFEGQGFSVQPDWTPSTSSTPPKTLICMSTHSNCIVLSMRNAVWDTARLCLLLALQFTVSWNINTGLWNEQKFWPERLSVAYYTCVLQTKLILKNWKYPQKSMFSATEEPTNVPLVVLG